MSEAHYHPVLRRGRGWYPQGVPRHRTSGRPHTRRQRRTRSAAHGDSTHAEQSSGEAVLDLKGLGELVTASEWKRAAIVWAFTADGRKSKDVYSVTDFAGLGISGLSSKPSVIKYRKAWAKAIAKTASLLTFVRATLSTDTWMRPGDLHP